MSYTPGTGGGGGGHTVQDEGTPLASRSGLNFVGTGVTATDDSANNRTTVTVQAGLDQATADPLYVNTNSLGDTMLGNLTVTSTNGVQRQITVSNPEELAYLRMAVSSAFPRAYLLADNNGAGGTPIQLSITGNPVEVSQDPTTPLGIATKSYVDSIPTIKSPVRLAETSSNRTPFPPTGPITIDGITTAPGNRILIGKQDDRTQNGIWIASDTAPWVRADDAKTTGTIKDGTVVAVEEGTTNQSNFIICTFVSPSPWNPGASINDWVKYGTPTSGHSFYPGQGLKLEGAKGDILNLIALDETLVTTDDGVRVFSSPKWKTAQSITLSGDIGGTVSGVDGLNPIAITTAIGAGVIVDADINASGITQAKVNNLITDLANRVLKAGDTMTGNLLVTSDIGTSRYIMISNPDEDSYLKFSTSGVTPNTSISSTIDGAGGTPTKLTITANPLEVSHAPTTTMGVATKGYVDQLPTIKLPVRLASVTGTPYTYPFTGLFTVDGVVTAAGDRVLIGKQTDRTQNGIWIASAGAWTRALDANTSGTIRDGTIVAAEEGTANGSNLIICTYVSPSPWNPGTSINDWIKYATTAGPPFEAGFGLQWTGAQSNQLDIVPADDTLVVTLDTIRVFSAPKWKTAQAITLSGDVTGTVSGVDGTGPINISNMAISPGVIEDADVKSTAAIATSKIAGLDSALAGRVPATRTVIAGNGLTGGGTLVSDVTLNVNPGAGITLVGDAVTVDTAYTKHTVQDEGVALTARSNINFTGTGVTATDDPANNRTVVAITGSGGVILQDEGTSLPARTYVNFVGAGVSATDDSANNRTNVTVPPWGPYEIAWPMGFLNFTTGGGNNVGYVGLLGNVSGSITQSIEITITTSYNTTPSNGRLSRRTDFFYNATTGALSIYGDQVTSDTKSEGPYGIAANYTIGAPITASNNRVLWPIQRINTAGGEQVAVKISLMQNDAIPQYYDLYKSFFYLYPPEPGGLGKRIGSTPWITPTLLNGWNDAGMGRPVQYRRTMDGQIYMRGHCGGGSSATATMFYLQEGFRPGYNSAFPVVNSRSTASPAIMGVLWVMMWDGAVSQGESANASASYVSVDSVHYFAV